jgi:aminopeptidase YwaD
MPRLKEHVWFAALGLLALAALSAAAAEVPLASEKLTRALADEISGEIAYRYTDAISKFDRVQASPGWHDSAVWIKAELERLGYKDATIEGWPSDGTRRYSTYRSVIGWRAQSAELWLVEPTRERLCFFAEMPITLVKHSGSGQAEAELVDVGSGVGEAAYRGRDVRGKIVLATGSPAEVMREAVQVRGAVGILLYYAPDTRPGYPDLVRYTAFWPRWEDRDKVGFGFNVSKNQGARLKRLLEEGRRVVLRAEVKTEFFPSQLEILTATLAGSARPDEEVILVAHLCHPTPSANDNASGSGGLLEMARALKRLVDAGAVPAPKRTIRFLWVPEFNGLMPYVLAHLERTRHALAAVNCDMIGEDLHLTGGMLNIFRTPDSRPSFLNDVMGNFAALAERLDLRSLNGSSHPFAWSLQPYSGGSDHVVFNDGALAVPAVMLNRDDTFHHTSLDTMDKVDPTELRRSCFIALGSVYYLAAAGDNEALATARVVARNGLGRLAGDFYDASAGLHEATSAEALYAAFRQVLNVAAFAVKRESQALLSTQALTANAATQREIAGMKVHLETLGLELPREARDAYVRLSTALGAMPRRLETTEEERRQSLVVPVRAADFVGPLEMDYLREKLGPDALKDVQLRGNAAYEALNFVDGRRSVYEIARAVSAEFSPVDVSAVAGFFSLLEKAGLVELKAALPARKR